MKRAVLIVGGAACVSLLAISIYAGSVGFFVYAHQNLSGAHP